MNPAWMLYGANGYTGQLIAEESRRRGMTPVLAGRRADAIRPLAEKLGFSWRAFALDSVDTVARELDGIGTMVLAAGPFSSTSAPVVDACLRVGANYLDITGEIAVFEACHARNAEARSRGCVVLPGVGFDVVPTDCLAASLKAALPDATKLELAFSSAGGFSRGTAKTVVEMMGQGGAIREDGRIRTVPFGYRARRVAFRDRERSAVSIPWGDVSTAFYSTGIGNITVYMAVPRRAARGLGVLRYARPLLASSLAQGLLKGLVERSITGPDEHTRRTVSSQLWGRVESASGKSVEGTLVTPEGYQLTMLSTVEAVTRVARGDVKPGTHTPATAFGANFIRELPDCDLRIGA